MTTRNARTVIVSGGGTGIGRAIAHSFVVSGDTVVIIGRRSSMLQETCAQLSQVTKSNDITGRIEAFPCDLENPRMVSELGKTISVQSTESLTSW